MAISIDTVLFVFLLIIVLDGLYYYNNSYNKRNEVGSNTLVASFTNMLSTSLPFLFMALAAFVVNYPSRTWVILAVGGAAWATVLVNRVQSNEFSSVADVEDPDVAGWKDVAWNVAQPLAAGALFAVPYVYIKTMQM